MRRCLFIFLIMFMPLQTAWSAAAVYCTHHEEGTDIMHIGHHSDHHDNSETDDSRLADSGNQSHDHHHHGGTLAIVALAPTIAVAPFSDNVLLTASAPVLSPPLGRIERPKWTRLA